MADTYEGWSNRETWAANLWLANDEGLYRTVRHMAMHALDEQDSSAEGIQAARYTLSNELEEMFDEWAHGDGEDDYLPDPGIYKMLDDIGSLYRVDWHEVAEGWITDAVDELTRGGGR